jgi:hypothetical protein
LVIPHFEMMMKICGVKDEVEVEGAKECFLFETPS